MAFIISVPIKRTLGVRLLSLEKKASFQQWHNRLGHPAFRTIRLVLNKHVLLIFSNKSHGVCEACQLGKSHQLPFSISSSICHAPLEFLHSDLWGPSPIPSINGHRYYVQFLDAFSKYT